MKTHIILLILFVGYCSPCYSQNYLITYDYTFQRDSNNLEGSEYTLPCRLYYNHEVGSMFTSIAKEKRDSFIWKTDVMDMIPESEIVALIMQLPKTHEFYSKIVKEKNKDHINVYDYLNTEYYTYKEVASFDWSIENEFKDISEYKCQKALCSYRGRHFEAWFTHEIPISDGPYKFFGLPGLIVKVDGDNGQFVFELTGVKQLDAPPEVSTILMIDEYEEVEYEKLLKARHERYNNFSRDDSGQGQVISRKGGRTTSEIDAFGKTKNNFIDRY